jgi:hypothetical protein
MEVVVPVVVVRWWRLATWMVVSMVVSSLFINKQKEGTYYLCS